MFELLNLAIVEESGKDFGDYLGMIMKFFPYVVSVASVVISVLTARKAKRTSGYLEVDKQYQVLLTQGVTNPDLRNPEKTRNYQDYKDDSQFYYSYCSYAYMIWNFIETIRDISLEKKKFRNMDNVWFPVILEETMLHYNWFLDNKRLFREEFQEYVNTTVNDVILEEADPIYFDSVYDKYCEDFPKDERKTKEQLVKLLREGKYHLFLLKFPNIEKIKIYENHYVGYMFIYEDDTHNIFLDYFAIDKKYRNRGYGKRAIDLLSKICEDKCIIIEVENPDGDLESMAARRKNFYRRNGAIDLFVKNYAMPSVDGPVFLDLMLIEGRKVKKIKREKEEKNYSCRCSEKAAKDYLKKSKNGLFWRFKEFFHREKGLVCNYEYNRDEVKKFVIDAAEYIHSDIPNRREIISKYEDNFPDRLIKREVCVDLGNIDTFKRIFNDMNDDYGRDDLIITMEQFAKIIKGGKYQFYVANKRGQRGIIGYAFCYQCDNGITFLDYLTIKNSERKKGYGTQLIECIRNLISKEQTILFEIDKEKTFDTFVMREFTKKIGGTVLDCDYFFPTKDGEIDLDLVIYTKKESIDASVIKESVKEAILTIHSDYGNHTKEVIDKYIETIPDFKDKK